MDDSVTNQEETTRLPHRTPALGLDQGICDLPPQAPYQASAQERSLAVNEDGERANNAEISQARKSCQEEVITLDMRNIPCPINFVRVKLKVDELEAGTIVLVKLDDGEPISSVSMSMQEEGHEIISQRQVSEGTWELILRKF